MGERCLIHGTEMHYDMRSGFELCYQCEAERPNDHEDRMALNLARSLERLSVAVKSLARVKDRKTLFEHSPTTDAEAYAAWTELDAAQKDAGVKLNGFRLWKVATNE